MTKLKPCPFCGGEATISDVGYSGEKFLAHCRELSCLAASGFIRKTQDEAISAWNRRAQPENKPLTLEVNANEIAREAQGLHADWLAYESMRHGGGQGAKSDDGEAGRKFMLWLVDGLPAMCELIESMQTQLADYHHMSELVDGKMKENQRLRRINENLQAQLSASQRRERAARNELCLKCGLYHDAYNGACDGCRWKET